ncbi:hypothetical protein J6590_070492 [Homalodisca vitripennis]|nr:hypothetical protein J6590_070492 [Homalodisca vitripennis]
MACNMEFPQEEPLDPSTRTTELSGVISQFTWLSKAFPSHLSQLGNRSNIVTNDCWLSKLTCFLPNAS